MAASRSHGKATLRSSCDVPRHGPGPPVASAPVPYDHDILDEPLRPKRVVPEVPATPGLVVEDRASGFVGAIVATSADSVTLRDRDGRDRLFRWRPGAFLVAGKAVTLVRPAAAPTPSTPEITASGSIADDGAARVARAGRIYVEGMHDAELLEHVWGDDLRHEGVVVEPVGGVDLLRAAVQRFRPGPGRRLGVLVDHLVPGSKEARVAAAVTGPHVLVTGHPYVDVWQGVRPAAAGITAWPVVPRGTEWKAGVLAALGHRGEPADFWKQLRGRVRSYADLESDLVGAVERLIDFVTEAGP